MPRGRGEQPPDGDPLNYGQPGSANDPGNTRDTISQATPSERVTRIVQPYGKHYTPRPTGPWPGARPRTAPVRRTTGPTAQSARQVSYNAANGPIPIGYGTLKTGVGFVLRPKVSGGFIYTAGVVSEGEIDSYIWTKIDGRLASEIGATINSYVGTSGQTTDTMLSGVEAQWATGLPNLAYHALKIPTGDFDVTKIETVWKGRKIYDPRSLTTAWSDNPALIWADLATNTRYGGCIPSADIDWTSVGDAADDCDATIATPPTAPTGAPVATRVVGGGNLSLSTGVGSGYTWTYTNVDTDGFESAGSPASNVLIVNDGDSATVSSVATGPAGTTKRNIYRTKKDGLTPRRFAGTINNNTGTSFTDTIADSALGGYPETGPYKRYTLDLLVQNVAPWPQWDESIRAHFACMKVWNSGKWKLIVDKAKSVSGVTFTDTGASRNLIGFPLVRTKGARERPELVTVSYINRFNDYSTASVQWPDPPAAAPKVEERYDFQGIPGHQALRLAKYLYNLRLRDREYTLRTMQLGAYPLPGAIVEVTSQRGPLTAEKMLLLNTEPDGLGWKHQLENYDAGVYSDTVTITKPPVVDPGDPNGIPPNVTGLTAPTATEAQIGTVYWTAAVWPNVAGYDVYDNRTAPAIYIRTVTTSPISSSPLDLKSYVTTDPDGTRHFSIKVVTVSATGQRSSGAVVSWDLSVAGAPRDKTIYNINNGAVFATGTGWATVRALTSGSIVTQGSAAGTLHIDAAEESGTPGDYSIWRAFFEFDLTGIFPSDAVIVSARLELYPKPYYPTRNTTIYAVASTAGAAPFVTADFDNVGATSFGSKALVATQVNAYYAIDLNTAGKAAINLSGMTKFALITDDDFNNTTPDNSFVHDVAYDSTELVANGVRLVVTYTSDIEDGTGPPTGVNTQTFTADGTWSKPPGVTNVHIICTGGGGSGGGGGAGLAGNSLNPGTGGGGGARVERTFPAADLPATVSVTVGAEVNGGAGFVKSASGAAGDGSNGTAGNSSSFGTLLKAYGGGYGMAITGLNGRTGGGGGGGLGAGANAASANVQGGAPSTTLVNAFGTGGASVAVNTTGPLAAEYGGAAGGGSGSGTSFSTVIRAGGRSLYGGGGGGGGTAPNGGGTIDNPGDGGAPGAYGGTGSGGAAGSNPGGTGTSGGAGDSTKAGQGGGGGAGAYSGSGNATAGNGGNGGAPGGGGGGGGGAAAPNANVATGGTGGNGARGEVVVISW